MKDTLCTVTPIQSPGNLAYTAYMGCLKVWTPHQDCTWAWNLHHNVPLEILICNINRTINYIRVHTEIVEQEGRFNNLRPVISELPDELTAAGNNYKRLWLQYGDWHNRRRFLEQYKTPPTTRWQDVADAYDEMLNQIEKHKAELHKLHTNDILNLTWTGQSIFES